MYTKQQMADIIDQYLNHVKSDFHKWLNEHYPEEDKLDEKLMNFADRNEISTGLFNSLMRYWAYAKTIPNNRYPKLSDINGLQSEDLLEIQGLGKSKVNELKAFAEKYNLIVY